MSRTDNTTSIMATIETTMCSEYRVPMSAGSHDTITPPSQECTPDNDYECLP